MDSTLPASHEIILIDDNQFSRFLSSALSEQSFSIFTPDDLSDLNLHHYHSTVAIVDTTFMKHGLSQKKYLWHEEEVFPRIVETAREYDLPVIICIPLHGDEVMQKTLHEAVSALRNTEERPVSIVQIGDMYGDITTAHTLSNHLEELVHHMPLAVHDEAELVWLMHTTDIVSALAELLETPPHALLEQYTLVPEEPITNIELAYFLKDISGSDSRVAFTEEEPSKQLAKKTYVPIYPDTWHPNVTLENGLLGYLKDHDIVLSGETHSYVSRETLEKQRSLLEEKLAHNRAKQEELVLSEPRDLWGDKDLHTIENKVELSEPSHPLQQDIPVEPTVEEKKEPRKQNKVRTLMPVSAKQGATVLSLLLFLVIGFPSVRYGYHVVFARQALAKAEDAMSQKKWGIAGTEARLAREHLTQLKSTPLLARAVMRVFSLTPEEMGTGLAQATIASSYLSQYALLASTADAKTPTVLGVSTSILTETDTLAELNDLLHVQTGITDKTPFTATVSDIAKQTPQLTSDIRAKQDVFRALQPLLGYERPMTYTFFFTDSRTLRPQSGVVTGLVRATVSRGDWAIQNIMTATEIDAKIASGEVAFSPPPALRAVTEADTMKFQDILWDLDFPTAAQSARAMLTQIGEPQTDGIFVGDDTFISALLQNGGAISLANTIMTDKNASATIASLPSETRKDAYRKIFDRFSAKAETPEKFYEFAAPLFMKKNLLLWHTDGSILQPFSSNGWTGELRATPDDFVAVFDSNLSQSAKTEDVSRSIEYRGTKTVEDGPYSRTISIRYTNSKQEDISGKNDYLTYVRVVLPIRTFLDSASIATQSGEKNITRTVSTIAFQNKTILATPLRALPGQSVTLKLTVESPRKSTEDKTLDVFIQKQPGAPDDDIFVHFTYPSGVPNGIALPEGFSLDKSSIFSKRLLNSDFSVKIPL